jgi:hypothetical protein
VTVPTIFITGPVGVGKTTVASDVSWIAADAGIPTYWRTAPRPGKDLRYPDALWPVVDSALLEECDVVPLTGSKPSKVKDATFQGFIVDLTQLD